MQGFWVLYWRSTFIRWSEYQDAESRLSWLGNRVTRRKLFSRTFSRQTSFPISHLSVGRRTTSDETLGNGSLDILQLHCLYLNRCYVRFLKLIVSYIFRVTLSLIGFLVVCATTREFVGMYLEIPMNPKTDSILLRALHCFSVINNSRKLLATSSSSDNLSCVHGIRVISTTWVIMGHTYFMLLVQPLISYTTINKVRKLGINYLLDWKLNLFHVFTTGPSKVAISNNYECNGICRYFFHVEWNACCLPPASWTGS